MRQWFTESDLWNLIKPLLLSDGHATRHEDRMSPGTPDVSYGLRHVNGWIELKSYRRWPRDVLVDPLPFRNLKPQQRRFLWKRAQTGGHTFVMVSVGLDILLISGIHANALGTLTRTQLYSIAAFRAARTIDRDWFISVLGAQEAAKVSSAVRPPVTVRRKRSFP